MIEDFRNLPAFRKAGICVRTPEREYIKQAGLEEGLRALIGLIMASSACPLLAPLRPMAMQHLPFASNQSSAAGGAAVPDAPVLQLPRGAACRLGN